MTQQLVLDDLLIRWHQWRAGYQPARGYNGRSLVVGEFQASRQNDAYNGALDTDIETAIMWQVEFEIMELPPVHYVAICALARALVLGLAVFTHPRLPADAQEREFVMQAARLTLLRRLQRAGVVDDA